MFFLHEVILEFISLSFIRISPLSGFNKPISKFTNELFPVPLFSKYTDSVTNFNF